MHKLSKMLLVLAAVTAGLLISTSLVKAETKTPNDQQLKAIKSGCNYAKVSLQRVDHDDLATRLILGRSYNTTLSLMKTLNARLIKNGISLDNVADLPIKLNTAYKTFYNDYKTYDDALNKTINTSCDQPADFYANLQSARSGRQKLHQDAADLDQIITNYKAAINGLLKQYKSADQAEAGE